MTSTLDTIEPANVSPTETEEVHLYETIIEARSNWRLLDWKELYNYRDLLRFLVWREVKVRYAQSAIGIGWAIIQPVFSMIVFTVIFGKLAKVGSDGSPYALFSLSALVPWTYFSNSLVDGTNSLVTEANMLKKVYFPRILMPLSAVFAKLVDFSIAMTLLLVLMIFFQTPPTWGVLMIPILILLMMFTAFGLACWLTAFAIQYRDVKHAMNFVVQLLMYAAPVVYPASLIPAKYQMYYALNPMVAVIEGFRSALLGTRPMPWQFIAIGILSSTCITLTGILYFNRKERIFADVA
ncbi:ABC transporter permease [Thalassoglobus sp.]|uniref:ABC transporter permease n=1 Tax=Thalassoglobus sp. TaxID=2795869 RepID=UPI003AA95B72